MAAQNEVHLFFWSTCCPGVQPVLWGQPRDQETFNPCLVKIIRKLVQFVHWGKAACGMLQEFVKNSALKQICAVLLTRNLWSLLLLDFSGSVMMLTVAFA